jgi:hypothetical protein
VSFKQVTKWKDEGKWAKKVKDEKIEAIPIEDDITGKTVVEHWRPDVGNTARKYYVNPVVQKQFLRFFNVNPDSEFGIKMMARNIYVDPDEDMKLMDKWDSGAGDGED